MAPKNGFAPGFTSAVGAKSVENSSLKWIPSEFQFLVAFLGPIGRRILYSPRLLCRLLAEFYALPDVTRHARRRNQQRHKRDEKAHHQPAHRNELGKNTRRVVPAGPGTPRP